jgi:PAS domain S-box-containing protein
VHARRELARWLRGRCDRIGARWSERAEADTLGRTVRLSSAAEVVPRLVARIAEILDVGEPSDPVRAADLERVAEGRGVEEVVAEHALLRSVALDCAIEEAIAPDRLRLLDEAIDEAIVRAVSRYAAMRARFVRAIDRIAALAVGATDLDALLPRLLSAILESSEGVDSAAVLLASGPELEVRASIGPLFEGTVGVRIQPGEGVAGRAAVERGPVDAREPPGVGPLSRARYAVPLLSGEQLVGVTVIGAPHEVSDDDRFVLRAIGSRVTLLVAQARTRRELERNMERFRALVLASHDVVWSAGPDGDVHSDNPSWSAFTGQSAGAFTGQHGWLAMVHPDDRDKARAGWDRAVATRTPWEGEFRLRRYDGDWRDVLERAVPLFDPDGAVREWVGADADVTLQRRAERELRRREEALRESEQRLRIALEGGRLGAWERDLVEDRLRWDARARELLGFGPDEPLDLARFMSRVHPDDRRRMKRDFKSTLAGGHERYVTEYRAVLPSGEERWIGAMGRVLFDPEGKATRVVGISQDITERRVAERALQEQRSLYESLLDAQSDLGEGVSILRPDRFVYVNEAHCRLLGYSRAELLEIDPLSLVQAERRPGIVARAQQWKRESMVQDHYETVLVRKDGTPIEVEVAVKGLSDGRFISLTRDVTQRRRVQEELQRDLEFRERVMGVLGHDLRNPLAAIHMAASLLLRRGALTAPSQRMVTTIDRSAERMQEMIAAISDFSHSRFKGLLPIRPEPSDFGDLTRRVLEEAELANPNAKLALFVEGDVQGTWDPHRLSQVVANLVANAVTHGRSGSEIRVELVGHDDAVELSVHNEGEPIPASVQAHIFEPFRQAQLPSAGMRVGLGLGLYIVQQVVLAHGGRVSVRSGEGEGTTFTVRLPRRVVTTQAA